jgi:hypothetical protein
MADLNVQVSHVDIGRQPDLLDLDYTLVFPRFLLPLGLLEPVFAVIHDAAHRGLGLRRYLDQIHTLLDGDIHRFLRGYDPQLLPGVGDEPDFFVTDVFIDLMFHAANAKAPPYWTLKNEKDGSSKPSVPQKNTPPRLHKPCGCVFLDPFASLRVRTLILLFCTQSIISAAARAVKQIFQFSPLLRTRAGTALARVAAEPPRQQQARRDPGAKWNRKQEREVCGGAEP